MLKKRGIIQLIALIAFGIFILLAILVFTGVIFYIVRGIWWLFVNPYMALLIVALISYWIYRVLSKKEK